MNSNKDKCEVVGIIPFFVDRKHRPRPPNHKRNRNTHPKQIMTFYTKQDKKYTNQRQKHLNYVIAQNIKKKLQMQLNQKKLKQLKQINQKRQNNKIQLNQKEQQGKKRLLELLEKNKNIYQAYRDKCSEKSKCFLFFPHRKQTTLYNSLRSKDWFSTNVQKEKGFSQEIKDILNTDQNNFSSKKLSQLNPITRIDISSNKQSKIPQTITKERVYTTLRKVRDKKIKTKIPKGILNTIRITEKSLQRTQSAHSINKSLKKSGVFSKNNTKFIRQRNLGNQSNTNNYNMLETSFGTVENHSFKSSVSNMSQLSSLARNSFEKKNNTNRKNSFEKTKDKIIDKNGKQRRHHVSIIQFIKRNTIKRYSRFSNILSYHHEIDQNINKSQLNLSELMSQSFINDQKQTIPCQISNNREFLEGIIKLGLSSYKEQKLIYTMMQKSRSRRGLLHRGLSQSSKQSELVYQDIQRYGIKLLNKKQNDIQSGQQDQKEYSKSGGSMRTENNQLRVQFLNKRIQKNIRIFTSQILKDAQSLFKSQLQIQKKTMQQLELNNDNFNSRTDFEQYFAYQAQNLDKVKARIGRILKCSRIFKNSNKHQKLQNFYKYSEKKLEELKKKIEKINSNIYDNCNENQQISNLMRKITGPVQNIITQQVKNPEIYIKLSPTNFFKGQLQLDLPYRSSQKKEKNSSGAGNQPIIQAYKELDFLLLQKQI